MNNNSKAMNELILAASIASIGYSVFLYLQGKKEAGIFVGLWAPTFLGLASFYNANRAADEVTGAA